LDVRAAYGIEFFVVADRMGFEHSRA